MNTLVKRNDFLISNLDERFKEYKSFEDIYRIEYRESFIKCAIQKTESGVQIIYLDSHYENNLQMKNLISYATFVIAYRVNDNNGFNQVEFNNNGDIISM